jgi:hypothetical protein
MGRWRGLIWIGFMVVLMLLVSGVLGDVFQPEPGRIQLESYSAAQTTRETYTVDSGSAPRLVIRGGLGDVMIQAGGASGEIMVEVTKIAYSASEQDAAEEIDDIFITTERAENTLSITTVQRQTNSPQRTNRVDLVITVPEEIALDVFVATGNIQITGVRAAGVFNARVVTGNVVIEDVIVLSGMAIQANAGSLTFAGTLGSEGDYALTASIGSLTVRLPAETNARLEALSTLGSITLEGFDLVDASEQQSGSGATLRGLMSEGGPALSITNQMGDIRIEAE